MASLQEIGQRLKEAREAKGLSLDDIAAKTRMTPRHLRAIEAGDESDLPEVFYVRGFLKKYAEAVGLAPAEIADAYRLAPTPQHTPQAMGSVAGPLAYYLLIGLIVAGVLALAWHFQPHLSVVAEPSPSPSPSVSPSPSPSPLPTLGPPAPGVVHPSAAATASPLASPTPGASPSGSPGPSASASASAAPSAAPGARAVVIMTIVGKAWVQVSVDGRPVLEGIFMPGMKRTFTGKSVEVSAGNAGGVHLNVNGQDRGALGERGVVVTRTFTP